MIKKIIKDEFFLKQKSKECTKEDTYIAQELLETIQAYKDQCVGMAANMIGYQKTMMVVLDEDDYLILINPVILKTSNKIYIAEEGCLSLQGVRKTQRYESIKVSYLDINFKKKIKPSKAIQHKSFNMNLIILKVKLFKITSFRCDLFISSVEKMNV